MPTPGLSSSVSRFERYPVSGSLDPVILDALHRIANHRQSLSREEAHAVMTEVLSGAPPIAPARS